LARPRQGCRTTVPEWHARAVGREESRDGDAEAKAWRRDSVAAQRAPASKEGRQRAVSRPSDADRAASATKTSGAWSPVVGRRGSPEEHRERPDEEFPETAWARSAPADWTMAPPRSAEGTVA
jgi:hypothetical protein